jgi:hypothetical protein
MQTWHGRFQQNTLWNLRHQLASCSGLPMPAGRAHSCPMGTKSRETIDLVIFDNIMSLTLGDQTNATGVEPGRASETVCLISSPDFEWISCFVAKSRRRVLPMRQC